MYEIIIEVNKQFKCIQIICHQILEKHDSENIEWSKYYICICGIHYTEHFIS